MEIKRCGETCFRIKGRETTLVLNAPADAKEVNGDLLLTSLKETPKNLDGVHKVFDWPGEYEANNVPIMGVPAWTVSKTDDEEGNKEENTTIIFCFVVDKVRFCHLGALGHTLTSDMVNEIGDVDILMIDTGKNSNLSLNKALEVIEAIDPKIVMPMGDTVIDEIEKEVGKGTIERIDKFSMKSTSELPVDKRRYIEVTI